MKPRTRTVVKPAEPAVSLDRFKAHARISHNLEDDLLRGFMWDATEHFQARTFQTLIKTTYIQDQDGWTNPICLRESPLMELESISYYDADNQLQTLDLVTVHVIIEDHSPGQICLADGQTWPETAVRPDAVQIRYTAGVAEVPDDLPQDIQTAVCMIAAYRNEERSAVNVGNIVNQMPLAVDIAINRWKTGFYANP